MLPEVNARIAGAAPLSRVLPESRGAGESALYLVYPSVRHLPAKLTAFRDFIVEWATRPDAGGAALQR